MDMTTHHSSSIRRSRKLRRRISSSAISWINSSPKSITSSPTKLPSRRISLSPASRTAPFHNYERSHLTDASDYEDHQPLNPNGKLPRGRSTSPARHIFEERPVPTAYASLPPTPIQPSRPFSPPTPVSPITPVSQSFEVVAPPSEPDTTPFSLWDYLREELLATDFDSHQELKWERVSNFLSIPLAIEKVKAGVHSCLACCNNLSL